MKRSNILRLLMLMLIALMPTGAAQSAEPLPFELQNGRGSSGLVFTVPASAGTKTPWSRDVRLVVSGDAPRETKNLRVISPVLLETEGGASAALSASLTLDATLAPGQWGTIGLKGEFPEPGVYRGELLLVQLTQQRVVPIQVTVQPATGALPALPLQEHGGKAVAADIAPWGDQTASLPVRLRNTGSEPLDIEAQFAAAARVDKPDNASYQFVLPKAGAPSQSRKIAPGAVALFELSIHDLDAPGIYSVETVFGEPSGKHQPLTVKTTLYRREPALLAALFVAIGALLAWLVRWFVADGNRRLALRRRIALLAENVRVFFLAAKSEDLLSAARVLEADVADRQRDVMWGGKPEDIEKIITRAEVRLALLHEVAGAMEQLKKIGPDKQVQSRKILEEALLVVRIDPGDEAKVTEQRTKVSGLLLSSVRRDQLRSQRDELVRQIEQQRRRGSSTLADALRTVEVSLVETDALLREDRLQDLERLLVTKRGEVLDAVRAELERLAAGAAPAGVDKDTWQRTSQRIGQALTRAKAELRWDDRYAALQEAQESYFRAAVDGLVRLAEEKAKEDNMPSERLRSIATELRAALEKDVAQAALLYVERLSEVTSAAPLVGPRPISRGSVSESAQQKGFSWFALLSSSSEPSLTQTKLPDANQISRVIRSTGWLVNASVLLVAVGTGVKVLWIDNLAWGGWGAWLAAFLWGAGVQTTGDLFTGLIGLRAKLGAPTGAP